jgi:hypothetical protein
VTVDWSPEVFPSCKDALVDVLLPHRVQETQEGWRVTELCTNPPEQSSDDGTPQDGSAGRGQTCETA